MSSPVRIGASRSPASRARTTERITGRPPSAYFPSGRSPPTAAPPGPPAPRAGPAARPGCRASRTAATSRATADDDVLHVGEGCRAPRRPSAGRQRAAGRHVPSAAVCPSTRSPTTRRTSTAIAHTTASTVTMPAPRASSSPEISVPRRAWSEAAARRPTSTQHGVGHEEHPTDRHRTGGGQAVVLADHRGQRATARRGGTRTRRSGPRPPGRRRAVPPCARAVQPRADRGERLHHKQQHHERPHHEGRSAPEQGQPGLALGPAAFGDEFARTGSAPPRPTAGRPRPSGRRRPAAPPPTANPSRFSTNAATACRCPARAPCGQSPQVQPLPWPPWALPRAPPAAPCLASCTATSDVRLPGPATPLR